MTSAPLLRITVAGQPELSHLYRVEDDSTVWLPEPGAIGVNGLTTRDVADHLSARLARSGVKPANVRVGFARRVRLED